MQSKETSTIRLRGIRKVYRIGGEMLAALDGIDLDIRRGEFAALMGPSGSGKSTLMNILGCLDRPSEGSYRLDGDEVAGLDDDALAMTRNKKIGFVFQNFNLLPRISALDNVALPLVYAGWGRHERTERAQEMLAAVGLGDRGQHLPNELSGGQRQALTLLMATLVKPNLLLLDEHTAALDPKTAAKVLELTQQIVAEDQLTTLMITHNMKDALRYGNRLIMLHEGRILFDVPQEKKEGLTTRDLLSMFEQAAGSELASDSLLLS